MRILLTGFEPFGTNKINASWETVKSFENVNIPGVEIFVRQTPISYKRAVGCMQQLLAELKPDAVIMTGQATGRKKITIERIAVNLMDARTPDNDGYQPEDLPIYEDGEFGYFTTTPIKALRDALIENGLPAKISNSAGLFVCNTILYEVLRLNKTVYPDLKAGFIHIPLLDEQAQDFPGRDTISREMAHNAIQIAIDLLK